MGFFDFLKPKKSKRDDTMAQLHAKIFPKGDKDINAVTDALLYILDHKISRDEAKNIAVKSVAISRISKEFNKERLRQHLGGYCLHHFNEKEIEDFHGYLATLMVAASIYNKSPSEVVRQGDSWVIPE